MELKQFTESQKRALKICTGVALAFGAFFLWDFFTLIIVAAISAFLALPLQRRFERYFKPNLAAFFTFIVALLIVIIPIVLIGVLAAYQITHSVGTAVDSLSGTNINTMGESLIGFINDTLKKIPLVDTQVTAESLTESIGNVARNIGDWLLSFLSSALPGVFSAFTMSIVYLYVFMSMLVKRRSIIEIFRGLNPLGDEISDLYLSKMAAMVKGTVKGQFVIALCQGVSGAASIYIAGVHEAFFVFVILLSVLSIIPLGSGIITIPLGIAMMLFGNVVGGLFVLLWHFIVVSNIDNVLRPILVPREARLDPGLMLLAVFAGIGMFGFWGVVIGPVVMILIVTTVKVYLQVYQGMEFSESGSSKKKRKLLQRT